MDKYNPYDPYTSSYQQYNSQYQQIPNTYQFIPQYQTDGYYHRSGERPSREYIGLGDFVVSDEDEPAYHEKHTREDDFVISDEVKSSDVPPDEISDHYDRDSYKYAAALKEEPFIRVTKKVRLGESVKNFEIAISNNTYLFWAQKFNDKYNLGEATLSKRRGRPKKDSVMNLLNACKK